MIGQIGPSGQSDQSSAIDAMIGRLIMVGIRGAEPGDPTLESELDACRSSRCGGVVLFDVDVPTRERLRAEGMGFEEASRHAIRNITGPEQVSRLVAHIRERLGPGTLVAVDQEGGGVARLNPMRGFLPSPAASRYAQMADDERRAAAAGLAEAVALAGIDINLAPCVDLAFPHGVIAKAGRAFARSAGDVIRFAGEQIAAHRRAGVGTCIKHFPGHGAHHADTHEGLVDVTSIWIEEELEPYAALLDPVAAASSRAHTVMVGHVVHRGIDPELPCSLSERAVTGLLRDRLGFDGVVMTDALDMRAISDRFGPGEAAVAAVLAGADLCLEASNLPTASQRCVAGVMHGALRRAFDDGRLSEQRLRASVERIERLRLELAAGAAGSGGSDPP